MPLEGLEGGAVLGQRVGVAAGTSGADEQRARRSAKGHVEASVLNEKL